MNNWDILGIAPTEDKREIKRAYAKMMAKYHPEEFPEKFEEINRAYKWAMKYNPNEYTDYDFADENFTENAAYSNPAADNKLDNIGDFEFIPFEQNPECNNPTTDNDFNNAENLEFIPFEYQEFLIKQINTETIFTADIATEEEKQAEKAFSEFSSLKMQADSRPRGYGGVSVIQKFVNSEAFISAKNNPIFIRDLTKLLPYANFNNLQIRAFRKAFAIKKPKQYIIVDVELNDALAKLERQFKRLLRHNMKMATVLHPRFDDVLAYIITFVLIFGITGLIAVFGGNSPTEPEPIRYTDDGTPSSYVMYMIIPQTADRLREDSGMLRSVLRTTTHIRITNWLYEETGREVWVATRCFAHLYGSLDMPQRVAFIFLDDEPYSRQIYWLDLYVFFDNDEVRRTHGNIHIRNVNKDIPALFTIYRTLPVTQSEFFSNVLTLAHHSELINRIWRDGATAFITAWIYEETEREVLVLSNFYPFWLDRSSSIPWRERIAFIFLDEQYYDVHWLYLYTDFKDEDL